MACCGLEKKPVQELLSANKQLAVICLMVDTHNYMHYAVLDWSESWVASVIRPEAKGKLRYLDVPIIAEANSISRVCTVVHCAVLEAIS